MRHHEILTESENNAILTDLVSLLIAAKASGIDQLNTENIVNQLVSMGHTVTVNSLLGMFEEDRPDIISNITQSEITLDVGDPDIAPDEETEDDFERDVGKQALQNIRDRAKDRQQLAKDL